MKKIITSIIIMLLASSINAQQSSLKLAKKDYLGTTEIEWDSGVKIDLISLKQELYKADFNSDSKPDFIGYQNLGQSWGRLTLYFSQNNSPKELLNFSYIDIHNDKSLKEGVWLYSKDIYGDSNKELFLLYNSINESWVNIISYSNGEFFTDKYYLNPQPLKQQYLLVNEKKILIPEGSHSMKEEKIKVYR